jgi:hypothetical protein
MIIATLGKQNDVLAKARAGGRRKNGFDSDDDSDEITEVIPPQPYGWAYVGSHNFTPSAWGTLSGSAFNPTLNVGDPLCLLLCRLMVFHRSPTTRSVSSYRSLTNSTQTVLPAGIGHRESTI